ncbi:MAG: type II toxin-antitoxin system prevent-host-death family antitoxin [Phycisphaeraceae bacterium]|nr:MAG: type II toxin-antitoxin system prevent-host-death family antitoxin [Phycisphaeraceae bacterium]
MRRKNPTEKRIGSYEAKTHLSRLLDDVEKGDAFTITRRGVPVARLTPVEGRDRDRVRKAIARLRAGRPGVGDADSGEIRRMIDEGRRR